MMKIKKKYQALIPESKVLNMRAASPIHTYSCDMINHITKDVIPIGTLFEYDGDTVPEGYEEVKGRPLFNYSTEEQVIGTWINGKPLYRKTFYFENFALQSDVITPTGISDVERAVNIYGCTYNGTYSVPINFYNAPLGSAYNHYAFFRYSDSAIWFNFYWGTEAYITLEYTKTTD